MHKMTRREIPIAVVYDVSYLASATEIRIETIALNFADSCTLQEVFEAIEEANRCGYTVVGNIKLIKNQ